MTSSHFMGKAMTHSIVIEPCRLACEKVVDLVFDLLIVFEALVCQGGLQRAKEVIVRGTKVGAVGWMGQNIPAKLLFNFSFVPEAMWGRALSCWKTDHSLSIRQRRSLFLDRCG